jgi:hypothetical protein
VTGGIAPYRHRLGPGEHGAGRSGKDPSPPGNPSPFRPRQSAGSPRTSHTRWNLWSLKDDALINRETVRPNARHHNYTFARRPFYESAALDAHCDGSSSPNDYLVICDVSADLPGEASDIADSVSLTDVAILLKDPAEGGEERVSVGVTSG